MYGGSCMAAEDFQADLLIGFAQLLAAAGLGTWTPSAGYPAGATGIVLDDTPETLDRAIQLSSYPVTEDTTFGGDDIGLQVIVRWGGADPLPSRRLDEQIFQALHGRSHFTLPTGLRITSCSRRSAASLGKDGSKRWSRSANYYVHVHHPSTYRV
jgi:hypothetical protein